MLEMAASQYECQGLEIDNAGVCWGEDFLWDGAEWNYSKLNGSRRRTVEKSSEKAYLRNGYRVLLTRARFGMVIFVPKGDTLDDTRPAESFDLTYSYLQSCGVPILSL